ncbi:Uncharacterised protein [uncultured archaeon]|nr:Uncharacterised protein [uncultured archaeon]
MEICIRLRGKGFCKEGFARSGRTVEQHAFRGFNAQALEYLRMAKRKFYHLSHFPDFVPETANILIRNPRDGRKLFCRLLAYLYSRAVADYDRIHDGFYRDHHEVHAPSHNIKFNGISPCDDPSFQVVGKVCLTSLDLQGLRGCEQDFFGRACLDLPYLYPVIDTDAGISPYSAVNTHQSRAAVLRITRPYQRCCPFRSFDAYDIACLQTEFVGNFRVDACNSPARIIGFCFSDF